MIILEHNKIERRVKVLKSKYSSIQPGMIGFGTQHPHGWEVLFENLEHKMPGIEKKQDTIIWFKFDEVEVVE